jgi:hypothetical protein
LGGSTIVVGLMRGVEAVGNFSDGKFRYLDELVAWSSSDSSIATVGRPWVRGEGPGRAEIAATYGSMIGRATVLVRADQLREIGLSPVAPVINLGDEIKFVATGFYDHGNEDNLIRQVAWSSSNSGVAVVSNFPKDTFYPGRLVAHGIGVTTITAQYAGRTASTTVTVMPVADASPD